jgi:hypothetical protein
MSDRYMKVRIRRPVGVGHAETMCWLKPADDNGTPVTPGCTILIPGEDDGAGTWVVMSGASRTVEEKDVPDDVRQGRKVSEMEVIQR